jgi:hypothetical protein
MLRPYSLRNRYLAKSFYYALHYIKPDVVVFLGDLMDEGSTSTDDDYQFYKTRFSAIFDISKFKSKVGVPVFCLLVILEF